MSIKILFFVQKHQTGAENLFKTTCSAVGKIRCRYKVQVALLNCFAQLDMTDTVAVANASGLKGMISQWIFVQKMHAIDFFQINRFASINLFK